MPGLDASCQLANAAAAIAALHAVRERIPWRPDAIARGVARAHAAARMQRFPGTPELIVDVAHNPQASRVLADWLQDHPVPGITFGVFGALADKDIPGIVEPLRDCIQRWQLAGLDADSPRGLGVLALLERLQGIAPFDVTGVHDTVEAALQAATTQASKGDRVVAFGSFFVAAAALRDVEARNP
jgi:dihydrofolate synthase/folylpolyglutamate synthase